jgi:hypothetical protein
MKNRALAALLVAAAISGIIWHLNHAPRTAREAATNGQAAADSAPSAESAKPVAQADAGEGTGDAGRRRGASPADEASVQSLLSSKAVDWNRVFSLFAKMPLDEVWNSLNAPGVATRNEAKAYKEQILSACSTVINSNGQTAPRSSIEEFCSDLTKIGDEDYFRQQYEILNKDSAFQQADFRILGKSTKGLSSKELADERSFLQDFIKNSQDPWSTAAAFDALWNMHDDSLIKNWDEIDPLSRFQRSRLKAFVRAQFACDAVGGCAPNNPWLLDLCTRMPGLICGSSISLDQIARSNLSVIELEALHHATGR